MKKFIPLVTLALLSVPYINAAHAADVQEKKQNLAKEQLEAREAQQELKLETNTKDRQDKKDELMEKQQDVKEAQQELKQETKKEGVEIDRKVNKAMQQISRASKIIGAAVKNPAGENLGDIKELVLDPESGQMVYAVVSFGGIMGLGDKLFAVPWRSLSWTGEKAYYELNVDKETLKKAPGFDKQQWPDSSSSWEILRGQINQFYRITP